jgi:hypothetical protein
VRDVLLIQRVHEITVKAPVNVRCDDIVRQGLDELPELVGIATEIIRSVARALATGS